MYLTSRNCSVKVGKKIYLWSWCVLEAHHVIWAKVSGDQYMSRSMQHEFPLQHPSLSVLWKPAAVRVPITAPQRAKEHFTKGLREVWKHQYRIIYGSDLCSMSLTIRDNQHKSLDLQTFNSDCTYVLNANIWVESFWLKTRCTKVINYKFSLVRWGFDLNLR